VEKFDDGASLMALRSSPSLPRRSVGEEDQCGSEVASLPLLGVISLFISETGFRRKLSCARVLARLHEVFAYQFKIS